MQKSIIAFCLLLLFSQSNRLWAIDRIEPIKKGELVLSVYTNSVSSTESIFGAMSNNDDAIEYLFYADSAFVVAPSNLDNVTLTYGLSNWLSAGCRFSLMGTIMGIARSEVLYPSLSAFVGGSHPLGERFFMKYHAEYNLDPLFASDNNYQSKSVDNGFNNIFLNVSFGGYFIQSSNHRFLASLTLSQVSRIPQKQFHPAFVEAFTAFYNLTSAEVEAIGIDYLTTNTLLASIALEYSYKAFSVFTSCNIPFYQYSSGGERVHFNDFYRFKELGLIEWLFTYTQIGLSWSLPLGGARE